MLKSSSNESIAAPTEDVVYNVLSRLGMHLEMSVDRSDVLGRDQVGSSDDPCIQLIRSAEQAGIVLNETESAEEPALIAFLREGYPIVIVKSDGSVLLLMTLAGGKFDAVEIGEQSESQRISQGQVRRLLRKEAATRVFVAKRQLDLDSISESPYHSIHDHHEHLSPLRRFSGLLRLELPDIGTVALFALVSGTLTLATPLAVESLVNVVSWGTYLQPLVVLGLILLTALGIAGVLIVLQKMVVELIQRRQFVRIVSDLSHRFPRANQESLEGQYPRELANRVFDIMTIQKATAVLLLDGVSIILTTILGMLLLAFYHPFLLGFNIVLLLSMISITWALGRGGIRTAIDESITKYRVAHWLQDVLDSPSIFKTGGGQALAVQRANQLTVDYVNARKKQFNVVIRQATFAIILQVIASTAVLALGGWLVIDGQLTLGQLVASELVVTVVVGAFAKSGKSLEKFYDLMAGVDKVGHLIDIPADPAQPLGALPDGPATVRWRDLVFNRPTGTSRVPSAAIASGARVAIVGDDVDGRSDLARTLAGLARPSAGIVEVGGYDAAAAFVDDTSQLVGYAGDKSVFHGSIRENVDLGRAWLGPNRVREVLSQVGLTDTVLRLSDGVQTVLQTGGYPLTSSQVARLAIARAIALRPKLLVIDCLLDELAPDVRDSIWSTLTAEQAPWTLIVVTNHEEIARRCGSQIAVRRVVT